MTDGTPNTTNRKAAQSDRPAQPQADDVGLNIADQPVVLEREEDVAKINQGDILEAFVRQHGAKNEDKT